MIMKSWTSISNSSFSLPYQPTQRPLTRTKKSLVRTFYLLPFLIIVKTELFPILELPKGIDGTLDPSLTSGLPTVVVRGFLNYMTIVDGVVIKFTKSAAMKNSITPTFPVLLIPTSVDSATATIQSTKSLNDNDVIIELNNKMGQTQVSRKKSEFHNPSSDIYPQKIPDRVTSSSNKSQITSADKLKVSRWNVWRFVIVIYVDEDESVQSKRGGYGSILRYLSQRSLCSWQNSWFSSTCWKTKASKVWK